LFTLYIAGLHGLVDFAPHAPSAFPLSLAGEGEDNLLTPISSPRTHAELDLTDQLAVRIFFEKEKTSYVFLATAKVSGVGQELVGFTCNLAFDPSKPEERYYLVLSEYVGKEEK
jgi:hypothetical protein